MNTHNNDGTFDSDNAGQPADYLREGCVHLREEDATLRENSIHLREEDVTLREDCVYLREADATLREQDIHETEATQAASDDHKLMLQQVNERLVITTIEAQKLAEQLQTTKDQMEIAKSMAEKANLAKSEFLSNMSHELRTPLNAILGFTQLLEAGSPPPTAIQKVRLHEIIKAGWYLLELINKILDLALIESGKLSLLAEPVSLVDVILECVTMIEPQVQQHGIKLIFLPCDTIGLAYADRTRVKQVLLNLLSNAIKYNREQGLIEVKCTLSTPERLRISIKDSGVGLSEEQIAQLFQSFNRLGQENSIKQGTGIGLVVAKQLVELMDGSIGVTSTVGVGSEFWIELPRDVTSQRIDGDTLLAKEAVLTQENTAPYTLLYVEDNLTNLMLVEHIIEPLPHLRIMSAPNGKIGLALARAHLPAIILMDITLPDISGIDVLKILRQDPATMHIPIIALSANAMSDDIEQGLKVGFFRYLTKPIKVNELISTLNEALKFSETLSDHAHKMEQA